MRIFTKLGIAFLLTVFATGMLWAQHSEAEIAAKMQNANLPDAYSKQVIGGGDIDADVIAVGKPMSMEKMKSLNIPTQKDNSKASDELEIIGSTQNSWNAGPRTRGNGFHCTVPDRLLVEFMGWHEVTIDPTQFWMLVYECEDALGTYDLIKAVDISPAPVGTGWVSSGIINVPLEVGKYYLLLSSFEQACSYHNQQNVTPFPYPVAFGEVIGGAGWDWLPTTSFPPAETQTPDPETWDNPVIYHQQLITEDLTTYDVDMGIQSILSPVQGDIGSEEIVTVDIKNYGLTAQSGFDVSYTMNGGTAVVETISETINSGETLEHTFAGTVDLSAFGSYEFVTWTDLAGDENINNDTVTTTVNNAAPSYCIASTGNEDEFIANVLCGSIDNASQWQGGVADYTFISTEIEAGMSEDITVTNGTPWADDQVRVWVDWNDDFEFEIGGDEEFVLTNDGTGAVFTGAIAVPADAASGMHRMRIRMVFSETPVPCGNSSYGEVEDYTISVPGTAPNDCENFDELTAGGLVAEQLGGMWTTWGGTSADDATVSDIYSNSPDNSFVVDAGTVDLIRKFDDVALDAGQWLYSNYIYVPTGFSGYFNVQSDPAPGVEWVVELFFNDDGTGNFTQNTIVTEFTYSQNSWILVEINFDLDANFAEIYFDGALMKVFAWDGTIGGIDYYGWDVGGAPGAYYDDVCFEDGWVYTGIGEQLVNSLQLYPNPATDQVNITSETSIESITVYNFAGQIVHTESVNNTSYRVNTSEFQAGVYLFQIETQEGKIAKRIVIE